MSKGKKSLSENDILKSESPYAATKISSDHEDLLSIDYDKRPLKNNIKKIEIIKKNSFEDFINKAYEKTKVYDAEIIYI